MSNTYLGIYQGSVVDNNDVLGVGRVTCLVPEVLADQPSTWCAPIYPTVYKPNVGDIVWIHFINGDLTKPIYFSSEAVTAEKIEAGTITFDNLAGSAVSQIVANSVAATRLTIGDTSNRVGDPFFDKQQPWVARAATMMTFLTSSSAGVPAGCPKPTLISCTDTLGGAIEEVSNNADATGHTFSISPGETYRTFISGACTDTGTHVMLGVWAYDKDMGNITWVPGDLIVNGVTGSQGYATAPTANAWNTYSFGFTIPNTIQGGALPAYAVPVFVVGSGTGTWYLTDWRLLEANAGLLLVDGSIIANGNINGGVITGATFQTSSAANTGIKVSGNTLNAYNGSGQATATIDGGTGNVTITGSFGTNIGNNPGVQILSPMFNSVYGGAPPVQFPQIVFRNSATPPAGARMPIIWTDTQGGSNLYVYGGGAQTTRQGIMKLDAGEVRLGLESLDANGNGTNEVGDDRLQITSGHLNLFSNGVMGFKTLAGGDQSMTAYSGTFSGSINASGAIAAGGNVSAGGSLTCNGTIGTSAGAFQFTDGGSTWREIRAASVIAETSSMHAAAGLFDDSANGGGVTAANIGSSGRVIRASTSSRKWKTNVVDMVSPNKILDLVPVEFEWRDQPDIAPDGTPDIGLIAEDVADAYPLMATYDKDGAPNGVRYDKVSLALLAVVKEQQATIEALTARVTALESK